MCSSDLAFIGELSWESWSVRARGEIVWARDPKGGGEVAEQSMGGEWARQSGSDELSDQRVLIAASGLHDDAIDRLLAEDLNDLGDAFLVVGEGAELVLAIASQVEFLGRDIDAPVGVTGLGTAKCRSTLTHGERPILANAGLMALATVRVEHQDATGDLAL